MKKYTENGTFGTGDVYVIETIDDFDELEKIYGTEFLKEHDPNFFIMKKKFEKFIGKIVKDNYKVIGLEDNNAFYDWLWVVQNVDDDRDIKYINILELY